MATALLFRTPVNVVGTGPAGMHPPQFTWGQALRALHPPQFTFRFFRGTTAYRRVQ
ncbi:MAG TPA: hypothetical protein VGB47_02005 [Thermoanaerobaculia bacterium]